AAHGEEPARQRLGDEAEGPEREVLAQPPAEADPDHRRHEQVGDQHHRQQCPQVDHEARLIMSFASISMNLGPLMKPLFHFSSNSALMLAAVISSSLRPWRIMSRMRVDIAASMSRYALSSAGFDTGPCPGMMRVLSLVMASTLSHAPITPSTLPPLAASMKGYMPLK